MLLLQTRAPDHLKRSPTHFLLTFWISGALLVIGLAVSVSRSHVATRCTVAGENLGSGAEQSSALPLALIEVLACSNVVSHFAEALSISGKIRNDRRPRC
jgi:hypothetical protein